MTALGGAIEAFRSAIVATGITPPANVIPDGKIHRFASNGKGNDDAGWYVFHADDPPAGAYGCWRSGINAKWHANDGTLSDAERQRLRVRLAAIRIHREAEDRERCAEATARAKKIWASAREAADTHGYLLRKRVHAYGVRVDASGRLIVPVMIDDALSSLQFITESGSKQFLQGGAVAGGTFALGETANARIILVAEGYATAATLHDATTLPVVVAFNAGNLELVAIALRAKYPKSKLVVCADDDAGTAGNPGITKATKASQAVSGWLAVPDFGADRPDGVSDFNDLAKLLGSDAVRVCIETATDQAAPRAVSRTIFRRVSDIQARPIHWLWQGRIARGKVSMIAGNPGLGKSQVTASMAAVVSTGGLWPVDGTPCEIGNVVILSAEDDPADTIRPRLETAGADLSRVFIIDAVTDGSSAEGGEIRRGFNLQSDLSRLEAMFEEIGGAALVVIDPITAYLGTTDSHKNAEIRALLSPLAELAGKYETAMVAVSHLNKNSTGEALMRVMGSLAFVAAARAAFVVARDPEDDARRLFLPLKNNLGNDQTGLAFTVDSVRLESAQGPIQTSRILWEAGAVTTTVEAVMSPQPVGEEKSELDDAKGFLQGLLADGPISSKQIRKDAEGAGHAWRTIQRAQKIMGVIAYKDGMKGGWLWRLVNHSRPEERQNTTKTGTPGDWHSSGPVGGLRTGDGKSVKETSETFRSQVPLVIAEAEEVIDLC